jgi:type IV fimbrial biogenesis protein FimT
MPEVLPFHNGPSFTSLLREMFHRNLLLITPPHIGRKMLKALRTLQTSLRRKKLKMSSGRRCYRIVLDSDGFTVTELAIGIAIISILAVVALPNIQLLLMQYRLNGATRQVIGDLMAARMKAVSQHRRFQVFFTDSQEYKICDDANGDNTVDNCEGSAQNRDLQTNYSGVSVSATNDPTFNSTGTALGNSTITLTNPHGTKSISVHITGQVKIN